MNIWQDHTLITARVTDQVKQWHHIGVMTTKKEKAKDCEFFFRAIAKAVKACTREGYKPNCLVADAAGAVINGFKNSFDYTDQDEYDSYQHVKRNIDLHSSVRVDKSVN